MDDSLIDFLGSTLLFSGLSKEKLISFAALSSLKNYKKGQLIFSEGDEARGFFIVKYGLVRVYKISINGREQTLHILGPGEPFGEVAVFIGLDYPAHAMALQDCQALFFPKDRFVKAIKEHPELALAMMGVLAMRLRTFSTMIENLSLKEVPQRLAAYLMALAAGRGVGMTKNEVKLAVTKNLLSTILGTSPETLSRVFKKMEGRGILKRIDDMIVIKNFEALKSLADGMSRLV